MLDIFPVCAQVHSLAAENAGVYKVSLNTSLKHGHAGYLQFGIFKKNFFKSLDTHLTYSCLYMCGIVF